MDFSISEEQQDLVDLARKILEDLATNDRLREVEAAEPVFDAELWAALGKANLLGLALPEAQGGSGYGFFELCLLLEELGRVTAPVPALETLALGALPIIEFGSDAQKKQYLSGVASGDGVLTAALSELDASDPQRPSTGARRNGEGWHLDGVKTGVASAHAARAVLVPAAADDGRVHVFLVDPRAPGVSLAPEQCIDRQPRSQMTLEGVTVTEGDRLGGDAGGAVLVWLLQRAVIASCAVQLGVCERALRLTADYGKERIQFDQPIGAFQAFHQRAGDAYINVEAIRLTVWEAAWRLSQGLDAGRHVEVAKYWAAEGGQFVAYACAHLHGGIGIDVDYPLHRYFIWATQLEHVLGSARAQLAVLGARLAEDGAPVYD